MNVSDTERRLRIQAAQSALASVRLAGLQPSQNIEKLFAAWAEGAESLDTIHDALMKEMETQR